MTFFLLSVKINIVVYENLKEELMKKFLKSQRGVTLIILVIIFTYMESQLKKTYHLLVIN